MNCTKFCKNVQLNETYLIAKFQSHRYFISKVMGQKLHFWVKFRTNAEYSAWRQRASQKTIRFSESSTLCASVSRQRIWSSSSPSQLKSLPKIGGIEFRKYLWRHNSWCNHVTGTKFCTKQRITSCHIVAKYHHHSYYSSKVMTKKLRFLTKKAPFLAQKNVFWP